MAELDARYARALFDLSRENGTLAKCIEHAAIVRDALQTDECRSIMEHPHISASEKSKFLDSVFAGGINSLLNDFLNLLISKNRQNIMVAALNSFIEMGKQVSGKVRAECVSAAKLDKNQISTLQTKLSKKLHKQVDLSVKVDPALIGGLYIYADGHYMDFTVKKRLNDMKNFVKSGEWLDGPQA